MEMRLCMHCHFATQRRLLCGWPTAWHFSGKKTGPPADHSQDREPIYIISADSIENISVDRTVPSNFQIFRFKDRMGHADSLWRFRWLYTSTSSSTQKCLKVSSWTHQRFFGICYSSQSNRAWVQSKPSKRWSADLDFLWGATLFETRFEIDGSRFESVPVCMCCLPFKSCPRHFHSHMKFTYHYFSFF